MFRRFVFCLGEMGGTVATTGATQGCWIHCRGFRRYRVIQCIRYSMPTVLPYPYSSVCGSPVRSGFKMYVYGYISDHLNPLAIRTTIRLTTFE